MSAAGGGLFPSPGEYHVAYGLNRQRFEKFVEKVIVMRPGPMNRGLEISAEATNSPRTIIVE